MTISAKFVFMRHYFDKWTNIYHAVYNTLDSHIPDACKVAPATTWNATMALNKIFDQQMLTYGKLMTNAIHQNNLTFITMYNPKDPPELLFKQCANCQEITIIAKVPYTSKQILMNVMDLFTCCSLFACHMDSWDQNLDVDKHIFSSGPSSKTLISITMRPSPSYLPKEDIATIALVA
jgi:hypothetical protein